MISEILSFNTIEPMPTDHQNMIVSREAKMKSSKNVNLDETKLKKKLIDQGKVNAE